MPSQERPGSDGEHLVQQRLGTTERADRFYGDQVLDHLNGRMREFVARQEMFFLATADRHGDCDSTFRPARRASSGCSTTGRWRIRNTVATVSWRPSAISRRTRGWASC